MDLSQLIAETFLSKKIDLLISKEHIHTLYYIAMASLDKEKAIIMKRETLEMRKKAMRKTREGFQDTTCLKLDLACLKERKCPWLWSRQLENCLRKQNKTKK